MDPLAVSRGPNEGAAAVLGRGNQIEFGQQIIAQRMRDLQEKKAKEAEMKALLSDEVKSKWASDNINYFQPKIEELRKDTIDLYKKKNGRLSDIDVFELKQKWAKLKNEAEVSNALYAEEQDRIKNLKEDPEFKKFDQESWKIRSAWNNPWDIYGEEIKSAGGIIPWRAARSQAFENLGAYSLESHLQETLKDKNSKWYIRDKSGNVITRKDPKTGLLIGEFREGIDPEKLSGHIGTIWNDPKDWRSSRMRDLAGKWVEENFQIDKDGKIVVNPDNPYASEVLKNSPALKGMSVDQMKAQIAKQYVVEEAKKRFPTKEGIFTEKPININTGSGSGSGAGDRDEMLWTTGLAKDVPNSFAFLSQPVKEALVGKERYLKNPEQAEKYLNDVVENMGITLASKYQNSPYVAMSFKTGKNNPVFTYHDREFISNGFIRKKDGKWYMVGSQPMSDSKDLISMIKEIKNENPSDTEEEATKKALRLFNTVEVPVNADVAVKHGFSGREGIRNMIKFLNNQVQEDF